MAATGITLEEVKHPLTFLVSEDSDGAGFLSRDTFTADGGVSGIEFVVGEVFAVKDGKAVKLAPAANDASKNFAGIAGYRVKLAAGASAQFMGINAHATVRGEDLTWPANITAAQKAAAVAQMNAAMIKVR